MATTIPEAFKVFKQNLEISDLQAETVSTRQQSIRDVLKSEFEIQESFLTGSYARNTMIAPLSEADIDIFVVLDSKHYYHYNGQNGGQGGLLDLVKRVLRKTYTKTPDISRNGQAVTIIFSDFQVDVVPGFARQGGGYLIPNSISNTWIGTDPRKHVEIMSQSNKDHSGDFIPLIKMIKAWNVKNGKYFNSFHLEVLALEIFDKVTISDFPSGCRFFFDKGRHSITKKNSDPAGYGGDIGSYINTQDKISESVGKFELAYDRAIKAESFARSGNNCEAIESWRKIFGDYFPAYG